MVGTYEDALDSRMHGTLIGAGGSRKAYLYNGVVYKWQFGEYAVGINRTEIRVYEELCSAILPDPIRIPEMSLYRLPRNEVIAAEYVEGQVMGECWCIPGKEECDATCLPDHIRLMASPFCHDLAGRNTIFDGRYFWLIDLEY